MSGWPMLTSDWSSNAFDVWDVLRQLNEMGVALILAVGVLSPVIGTFEHRRCLQTSGIPDLHNASQNVLSLSVVSGISKDILGTDAGTKYVAKYPELLLKVAELLDGEASSNNKSSRFTGMAAKAEIQDVLALELFFTNGSL